MATTAPTVSVTGSAQAHGPARPIAPVAGGGPAAWLVAAAVVALGLALRLPIATTVLGLAAFGVLHNALELRYVLGRFEAVLTGPFLWLLLGLITGVLICRLLPVSFGRPAEIVLCYALLMAACGWVWRHRPVLLAAALALLGLAAAASLAFPAYHFVVFTHLHNVVPLFFLWQWSAGLPTGRTAVRAATLGWVLGVPALLLGGVLDRWLHASATGLAGFGGGSTGFGVARVAGPLTPPVWLDTGVAVRFLAVFAFLQTMHYVVWVGVLPRYAPDAAARFEARVPVLRGRRVWLLGIAGGLALGVLFGLDYATGKTLYAAVASYHAYLEFPVLLALILGHKGVRR
jgi:hypothetical protein